jgi:RNA recognition motif-containing protein
MNIFIAKLSYETTEDQVRKLFEAFGEVTSVKIIYDRAEGRSKGFGFVEMADDDEGRNAIEGLNNKKVDGRNIVVKESEPREQNRPNYRSRDRY